jgi:membrane dipeptidase
MDHFEYVKDLVGEEHVAFGPDTLYGDHVGLHNAFAESLSIGQTQQSQSGGQDKKPQFEKVEYVKGIENPTEGSHNILRWLVKNGYSDETIAKVMGQNILRVLKDVWH